MEQNSSFIPQFTQTKEKETRQNNRGREYFVVQGMVSHKGWGGGRAQCPDMSIISPRAVFFAVPTKLQDDLLSSTQPGRSKV